MIKKKTQDNQANPQLGSWDRDNPIKKRWSIIPNQPNC
jgi:hypothetical protein